MVRDDKSKVLPQYVAAMSAAGGALACGTILGWSNPVQKEVMSGGLGFPVSSHEFSWVGSAIPLGAACICIPIGIMITLIGRRPTMLLLVIPFTIGWALLIFASNVSMMIAARFLLGVSGGAFCVSAPMYTGEIALKDIRGTLGSFFQLMITTGILFVYAVGAITNTFWTSVICGTIPLIFGVIFFFMPESPTYLIQKNKPEAAVKSIQWLRGKEFDYKPEIDELQTIQNQISENTVPFYQALKRPITLKSLSISLGLMFFQQMSGINCVIFYSTEIFADADTGINESLSTNIFGVMQVIATFISVLIVDKSGRRLLLLASAVMMATSTALLGVYFYMKENDAQSVKTIGWLPVTSVCMFIIMFSIGFGPVPWLMMGELFATDIKGVAGSIAGTFNWMLAFFVTKTFQDLKEILGVGQTFWFFSLITVVGALFVIFIVPETKGKSLHEIQEMLLGKK